MVYIAFDSNKKYTFAIVKNEKAELIEHKEDRASVREDKGIFGRL